MRQRLEAAAFVSASAFLSAWPRAWSIGLAHALGPVAARLLGSRRRVVEENLRCTELGAALGPDERRRLAARTLGHSLALGLDVLTLPRVARAPGRYCEIEERSVEVLREASGRERGVVLVASHFGLMESMGMILGEVLQGMEQRLSFVAKPFPNPHLDRAVQRWRGATGNRTIHKGGAKASLLEVLGRGEFAAVVLDQHVGHRTRLWIPFLGLPAATTGTLGTVAVETGAPVVLIHSFPLPGGRCRVECGPILEPRPELEPAAAAEDLVRRAVEAQGAAVRREPAAWNWIHRRWKVRPDRTEHEYPRYSVTETEERRLLAERARRLESRRAAARPGPGG